MKTINLLPSSEQEILRQEKMLATLRRFVIVSFLSYAAVALVFIASRFFLLEHLSTLDVEIQKQKIIISKQDNTALKTQVEKNNAIVSDYNNLAQANPRWSAVLEEFALLVPADLVVKSFSANTATGKIDIAGSSLSRDSVLRLRANLASSKLFKNVDLPLENLQKPFNADFHYTFYLQDKVLSQ